MARIPHEDLYPRHQYGDYTHTSPGGGYRFEWTPYTPAIVAWQKAEFRIRSVLANLRAARQLPGFALNGLQGEHQRMMTALDKFIEDGETSRREALNVIRVLEEAHRDYAAANEASYEEYQRVMALIDGVIGDQTDRRWRQEYHEGQSEGRRDRDIFPYDEPAAPAASATPGPSPSPPPPGSSSSPAGPTADPSPSPGPAATPP
jgi:hypothetical protein